MHARLSPPTHSPLLTLTTTVCHCRSVTAHRHMAAWPRKHNLSVSSWSQLVQLQHSLQQSTTQTHSPLLTITSVVYLNYFVRAHRHMAAWPCRHESCGSSWSQLWWCTFSTCCSRALSRPTHHYSSLPVCVPLLFCQSAQAHGCVAA